jgi:hypothetical protein
MTDILLAVDVLSSHGFNLWASPKFIEFYVAQLLNGQLSKQNSAHDIEMDGIKVEVKSSQKQPGYPDSTLGYRWRHIRGRNEHKNGRVDVYVLVGIDGDNLPEFWVLPPQAARKTNSIRVSENNRKHWLDRYYVGRDQKQVRKAIYALRRGRLI